MKRYLVYILLLASFLTAGAQDRKSAGISNIRLETENNDVLVYYDILNSSPDSLHNISLSFITTDNEIFVPQELSGDIGMGIAGTKNRMIRWLVSKEMDKLTVGYKPYLVVDGISSEDISSGGPDNMFLSMLIPGLGDYFVARPKNMIFKPYLRTTAVASFIALGYYAGRERWVDIEESVILRRSYVYGEGYKEWEETVTMAGDTHYRFFRHDAEIFYTIGAAIWIADIFWVLNKGYQNNLLNKSINNSSVSFTASASGASLTLTF